MKATVLERDGQRLMVLPADFAVSDELNVERDGDKLTVTPLKPRAPTGPEFWAERAQFWAEIDALRDTDRLFPEPLPDEPAPPPIDFGR